MEPPGTGKTLLVKAVAGVPLYSLSYSGFVEMFIGALGVRLLPGNTSCSL